MSWVTLDRICQEKVDKEGVRSELVRNGRPLRSSAEPLSDDELLAKLRDFGLDVDRDGVRYAFLARRPGSRGFFSCRVMSWIRPAPKSFS
jgi:hypothetical protein